MGEFQRVKDTNTRFVHYTSAEAALKILRSREIWLRKASAMADYRELQHGLHWLRTCYNNTVHGNELKSLLNSMFAGFTDRLEPLFNNLTSSMLTETYLTCFSEHYDGDDAYGRLSMWRAYGGRAGVAIVVRNGPFEGKAEEFRAFSSPVAYWDEGGFSNAFANVVANIRNNRAFIEALQVDVALGYVIRTFTFFVLCTKHPAFLEEREWRVVYCPALGKSEHINEDVVVIDGTPQRVCKVALRNIPEIGLVGVEIPELVERILIGPSRFPLEMYQAFVSTLTEAGMGNADRRVMGTGIPLRA